MNSQEAPEGFAFLNKEGNIATQVPFQSFNKDILKMLCISQLGRLQWTYFMQSAVKLPELLTRAD